MTKDDLNRLVANALQQFTDGLKVRNSSDDGELINTMRQTQRAGAEEDQEKEDDVNIIESMSIERAKEDRKRSYYQLTNLMNTHNANWKAVENNKLLQLIDNFDVYRDIARTAKRGAKTFEHINAFT